MSQVPPSCGGPGLVAACHGSAASRRLGRSTSGTLAAMTLASARSAGPQSALELGIKPVAGAVGAEVRGRHRSDKTAASGYFGMAGFEF